MSIRSRPLLLGLAALAAVPAALGAARTTSHGAAPQVTVPPVGVVVHVVYDGQGTSTETDKSFPPQGGSITTYTETTHLSWHLVWDLDLGLIPKQLGPERNYFGTPDAEKSYLKGSTAITTNVDQPCNASDLQLGSSGPFPLGILGPAKGRVLNVQALAYSTINGRCRPRSLFLTVNPLVAGEPRSAPFAANQKGSPCCSFKLDLDDWEAKQTRALAASGAKPPGKQKEIAVKENRPWSFQSSSSSGTTSISGNVSWSGTVKLSSQPAYVAIGDSFAAGSGVAAPFAACGRAEGAYEKIYDSNVDLRACSGAPSSAVYSSYNGEPPQANHVTKSTRLVTVQIGANDTLLFAYLELCYGEHKLGSRQTCAALHGRQVNGFLAQLPGRLVRAYKAIRARSKTARIFVLGYPNPLPARPPAGCAGIVVHASPLPLKSRVLAAPDVVWFHDQIERINGVIAAAVSRANVRAVYVSPNTSGYSFVGHDVCSRSSWFVPLKLIPIEQSLHPNEAGNQDLAGLLRRYAGRPPG